ncbi:MAG: DUF262 domain-containing protein [Gloeotrichia echinulata GP01]
MNDKISVKPDTIYLEDLLKDIANGEYKIPIFQREFVWNSSQMLKLFDSILKGYPIGSLLFWKTKGYKTKDQIGPYTIKKQNSDVGYVLDGFQRISTLFGVLMNPEEFTEKNEIELKKFLIYFDIRENNFNFIHIRNRTDKDVFSIPLYKIYDNRELFNVLRELDKEDITEIDKNKYIDNARNLHDVLHKYKLPCVEIKGGDIKSAVEIFSRLNSTGTKISEDYILSARSYGKTEFNLIDSITEFLDSLNIYNFEDLKRDTILDCISNATGKIYFDVKTEELLKQNLKLELFTENAYTHIKKSVDFLYKNLFIIHFRLLPYPSQLIFISEYFRLNPEPTDEQLKALKKWFWVTTYSNYFTLYSLSQQRSAYQVFYEFANGEHPDGIYKLNNDMQFTTAKYPSKLSFAGVRPKALQLFYLKSIITNSDIQEKEGIKEMFISSKKDRTPASIILRLSSEFEEDKAKKQTKNFLETSSSEILMQHFITQEMVELYKAGKIDEFISIRENYLKSKESEFVQEMGIKYEN